MSVHLGAGWHLVHLTDREVHLRKDDPVYRRLTGCDGWVEACGEPGMDRQALINTAVALAKEQDERLAQRVSEQLMLRNPGPYLRRQRQLSMAFRTPEAPQVIGVKRP